MSNKTKTSESLSDIQDDLQHLFKVAELRSSELRFYLDETHFLKNLLDKYLLWLMEEESMESLKKISARLVDVEKKAEKIIQSNESSINRIGATIENAFTQDEFKVRSDFRQQGDELEQLSLDMKAIKGDIFRLVEQCFRTEKARKLLGMHK